MKFLDFIEKWPISVGLVISTLVVLFVLPTQEPPQLQTIAEVPEPLALLYLTPSEKTLAVGELLEVAIFLTTKEAKVDGVEAVLGYNPQMLKALKVEGGTLFEEYPLEKIDEEKGQIQLTGLTLDAQEKTGTLGYVTFEALGRGVTNIFFEFASGSGKDSNVALTKSGGADVLKEVENGRYVIE